MDARNEDTMYLEEFDVNFPSTITLLRTPGGAKVFLVGTGHLSIESQDNGSKVDRIQPPNDLEKIVKLI